MSINARELVDFLTGSSSPPMRAFELAVSTAAGEDVIFDIERPFDLPLGGTRSIRQRCWRRADRA